MTEKIWKASDFLVEHTNDMGKKFEVNKRRFAGMIFGPCIGYVI